MSLDKLYYQNYEFKSHNNNYNNNNFNYFIGFCYHCQKKLMSNDKLFHYLVSRNVALFRGESLVCPECKALYFNPCKNCGCLQKLEDLNNDLCLNCFNNHYKDIIRNYTFKVDQEIDFIGKSQDSIYFGTETEYESVNIPSDAYLINSLVHNFARLKRDSSLQEGFEIVTAPITIEKHYEIWNEVLPKFPNTVYPLRTCGMHVHVSRVRLTDLQIGKLLCFIHNPENYKFIKLIAQRPSNFHNDFITPKKISDGQNGGRLPQNAERHTALNLNGDKTIEFRIFRSTKDPNELLKNIEFCKAMVKFTGSAEFSVEDSKKWKNFVDFSFSYGKDYMYLNRFLKRNLHKIN